MIDLDYYTWREPVTIDGRQRLLIPLSDPMRYEHPADGIFTTVDEALGYLTDWWDHEDTDQWVLIHYTGRVVPVQHDQEALR